MLKIIATGGDFKHILSVGSYYFRSKWAVVYVTVKIYHVTYGGGMEYLQNNTETSFRWLIYLTTIRVNCNK